MSRKDRRRGARQPARPSDDSTPPAWTRPWPLVLAMLAIAAFVGAVVAIDVGPHRVGGLDAETDFYGGYAPAAAALAHGHLLTPQGTLPSVFGFVGPLYPVALALIGSWSAAYFRAAEALSAISALLVILLWGDLLRRWFGRAAAAWGVLLLASNAVLFRQAYWVTTDAMAIALQSLAVWLLLARPVRGAVIAAGVAAALAFLTRYTSAYLLPAGCVVIALSRTEPRVRARELAAFAIGFLLPAVPWMTYARSHGASVQFHQLLAFDVYGAGMPWDRFLDQVWPRFEHHPVAVLTTAPGAVAARLAHNAVDHAWRDARELLGWPVSALVAAGLAIMFQRRDRRLAALVVVAAWSYAALIPAGYNDRYALAVLPFGAALAAFAVAALAALPPRRLTATLAGVLGLLVVALAAWQSVREQRSVLARQPLELLACADTLRSQARPADRVIARKPHVGWLGGVQSAPYPEADDLPSLGAAARQAGAEWLYESAAEVILRPGTAFLLDTTAVIPGLTRRAVSVVPMRFESGLRWERMGILYRIGPAFGQNPAWFANDTLRTLHLLRGITATQPNANTWLRRAACELMVGDTLAARSAWRTASRLDPPGAAGLLLRGGGDTLGTIRSAGS